MRRHQRLLLALVALGAWGTAVAAGEVSIVAAVDKTSLDVGQPLTLTITLTGDLSGLQAGPNVELPPTFAVASRSQASRLSIQGAGVERSVSFTYVLVAQEAGTFQLGPFVIDHGGQPLASDPILVVVGKPVLPPGSEDQLRYIL